MEETQSGDVKNIQHGFDFAGEVGVLLGEGGNGLFQAIGGGPASTVVNHSSRSD